MSDDESKALLYGWMIPFLWVMFSGYAIYYALTLYRVWRKPHDPQTPQDVDSHQPPATRA